MFRKLALASSIAAITTASYAGTFETNGFTQPIHSVEGAKNVADADGLATGSVLLKLGAEYAANDTITFTFNNAKATNSNWPTSLTSVTPGTGASTLGAAATAADTTLNFAASTNYVAGDIVTLGTDTTQYRIKSLGTAAAVTMTPVVAVTVANGAAIITRNNKTISLGLVNSTDSSATYRVISVGGAGSPTSSVGTLIPTPMINVKTSDAIARATTISVASATSTGSAMDTTAGTAGVMSTVTQYGFKIGTAFNQTVDVEQNSKAFVGGDTTTGTDVLGITFTAGTTGAGATATVSGAGVLTQNAATAAVVASINSVVHTITGDLAFMDDDAATAGVQSTSGLTDNVGSITPALQTTGTTFTLTDTSMTSVNATITKDQAAAVIPTQTFSGSAKTLYTSNTVTASDTITYTGVGTWGLNGAAITVYGVPMGTTVDRMIWVNNKGASAAAVTASVVAGGVTTSDLSLGTVAAASSTSVDEALDTALAAAGVTLPANSRATVTLSAPVKAADVTVSASYKVIADNDRLSLETSDTIQDSVSVSGTIAPSSDCADATVVQAVGSAAATTLTITNTIRTATSTDAIAAQAMTMGNINIDDIDCASGGGTVATTTVAK
jgi:hypothetical protein